jgi:cation diffusion facilitator CzcD-associated flavoprotein CzcO
MAEHYDILIIGAGLSGICAAHYLQQRCPSKRFAILEGRDAIGGTWDLFRYPGVRSDSDMHTLGYSFRPWHGAQSIGEGGAILRYIRETAHERGIERHIRFGHRVLRAAWSSAANTWTLEVACGSEQRPERFTCGFLFMCNGYYDYAAGYTPEWPGVEDFAGRIVHPQHWPADLDYAGKRIIVIGSGATAVTIVPALAQQAAHVTMLQRSPTYMLALPTEDASVARFYRRFPRAIAHSLARWKSIITGLAFYLLARKRPARVRRELLQQAANQLGPAADIAHFTPRYNPWDQRLCVAPDGDLFAAIRNGSASVVTGRIARFTPGGIQLQSGAELAAEIIVTATGLTLNLLRSVPLTIDGAPVEIASRLTYRGAMYSDIPNFVAVFGYTNASWTLKAELIADYACRVLNHMDRRGYTRCIPRRGGAPAADTPAFPLSSGYVQRARDTLPRQGVREPWRIHQNYFRDLLSLRFSPLDDGVLEFL